LKDSAQKAIVKTVDMQTVGTSGLWKRLMDLVY